MNRMKNTISLCMIVKNEERFLARCLSSVQGIVEEIVIVDTGSTDSTIEIAKFFNATVVSFNWVNDFSKARNEALKYAKSDYILVLDADEYLDEDHAQLMKPLDKDAYFINIRSALKGGISTVHPVIRLFRNCPELKFTGKIHEQILVPSEKGLSTEYTQLLVHHDGYLLDVIAEKNKQERNLAMLLAELKENETGFTLFNLRIQYKTMGKYKQAIAMLEKAFPLSTGYSYVSKLISSLIQCYMELGEYQNALVICNEAISAFSEYTDLYYLQGQIYESINYMNDAKRSYRRCIELGEVKVPDFITYQGIGSYMPMTSLAAIQYKHGDIQDAINNVSNAIQLNKHYMPAVKLMIDMTRGFSEADAFAYVLKIWGISSLEDLREMIGVLFKMRHPLLYKFSELYQHNVDEDIKAVMYLYSGRYQEAAEFWMNSNCSLNDELGSDLILCAILLENRELIMNIKSKLSYRGTDLKLLVKIARREAVDEIKWTSDLSDLLINIFEKLIVLKEFNIVEYFISSMSSYSLQFGFAKCLFAYGFRDIAFQIMENQLSKIDRDGLVWIGNSLMIERNDQESLNFFELALSKGITFDVLEKCYEIYVRNNQIDKVENIVSQMKKMVPISEWAKQIRTL